MFPKISPQTTQSITRMKLGRGEPSSQKKYPINISTQEDHVNGYEEAILDVTDKSRQAVVFAPIRHSREGGNLALQ